MNPYCLLGGALLVLTSLGCQQEVTEVANSTLPIARVSPHEMEEHGNTRVDNYYWLRERDNPEVIDYLEAENAYARDSMAHTQALQDELLAELQGRLQQDDASVPYRLDDYFYYTRFSEGQEYPIHCRKKGSLDAAEEILVDGNELAEGHGFFAMPTVAASSSHDVLAFATDTVGRRIYTLRFKDLTTGDIAPSNALNVPGSDWSAPVRSSAASSLNSSQRAAGENSRSSKSNKPKRRRNEIIRSTAGSSAAGISI